MAKKYLDLTGLSNYDTYIKRYIGDLSGYTTKQSSIDTAGAGFSALFAQFTIAYKGVDPETITVEGIDEQEEPVDIPILLYLWARSFGGSSFFADIEQEGTGDLSGKNLMVITENIDKLPELDCFIIGLHHAPLLHIYGKGSLVIMEIIRHELLIDFNNLPEEPKGEGEGDPSLADVFEYFSELFAMGEMISETAIYMPILGEGILVEIANDYKTILTEKGKPPSEEGVQDTYTFMDMIVFDTEWVGYNPADITVTGVEPSGKDLLFFALYSIALGAGGTITAPVTFSQVIDFTKIQFKLYGGEWLVEPDPQGEMLKGATITSETYDTGGKQGVKFVVDYGDFKKDVIFTNDGYLIIQDHTEEENGGETPAEITDSDYVDLGDYGYYTVTNKYINLDPQDVDVGMGGDISWRVAPILLAINTEHTTMSQTEVDKLFANQVKSIIAKGSGYFFGTDNIEYTADPDRDFKSMTMYGCSRPIFENNTTTIQTIQILFADDYDGGYDITRIVLESGEDAGAGIAQVSKTLESENWSDKELTLTVSGITSTSVIWVSPKADSRKAFADAEIFASGQGINSITFICEETPDDDIDIVVAFM